MDISSYIRRADNYASLRAYECIDNLRINKELIVNIPDIEITLDLIDSNRIGFNASIHTYRERPQVSLESVKHDYNIRSNDANNAFESMFLESMTTPFDEYKESNDRNLNKLDMLKAFNKYLILRIDNIVSKTLLPIYGNIASESDIDVLTDSDTRATVLVSEPKPQEKLSQAYSIGDRVYDLFFSSDKIGTASKVIEEALSDPQIRKTERLNELMRDVISKYIQDYDRFLENENLSLAEMYEKLGTILSTKLRIGDSESTELRSLISDIIIILECIFILSNDRYNVL